MGIEDKVRAMKVNASKMAAMSREKRDEALAAILEALEEEKEKIFAANRRDMERAEEEGISAAVLKRLKFQEEKLKDTLKGIFGLMQLEDPLGRIELQRELDDDLVLTRVTVPIGVIGVIFEARPDAMVQIASLCIKSGNCAILKGGSEAMETNKIVFDIMYRAALEAGMPENCMMQIEARSGIHELLDCDDSVDLLIPRGSNSFVQYIMNHTKIPVMGHADGICHLYADRQLDLDQALDVILDAKIQYTAACNAMETLLVHREIAPLLLPPLEKRLAQAGVEVRASKEARQYMEAIPATEEDFAREYLDKILSIKLVDDIAEAVDHINRYGSHHTDGILTRDSYAAKYFMQFVDSAGVYHNCSTRFADGYRYGFGAEVGISTGKLHARGPVGLEGLCTYKYILQGNGNIVADYAEGRKEFHFQDLL